MCVGRLSTRIFAELCLSKAVGGLKIIESFALLSFWHLCVNSDILLNSEPEFAMN